MSSGLRAPLWSAVACMSLVAACERKPPLRHDVEIVVQTFEKAVLAKDCKLAWGMLAESARLATDYEHFCKRLGGGCAGGDVRIGFSEPMAGGFFVTGNKRCPGGRDISFRLEVVEEPKRWAVATFSEGDWVD